jgi:outer membrane protein assembly factor BamB
MSELIYVGFNSRIAALDRATGELVWDLKSPHGSGFVALLLDREQLIVSVQGYTWSLDPLTGDTLWENFLKGFGYGVPCLVSTAGSTLSQSTLAEEEHLARQRAAASNSSTTGTAGH